MINSAKFFLDSAISCMSHPIKSYEWNVSYAPTESPDVLSVLDEKSHYATKNITLVISLI